MNTWHKDGAKLAWIAAVYFNSAYIGLFGDGTNGTSMDVSCYVQIAADGRYGFRVVKGSGNAFSSPETAGDISAGWNIIGGVIDENGGNVSFRWKNGAYVQESGNDTFNANYTSPSSSSATNTLGLGAIGDASGASASGFRIACLAMWDTTLPTKGNLDTIYTTLRTRFGL